LPLAFASTVILDPGPHGTRDHIFLSHNQQLCNCAFGQLGKLVLVFTSTVILGSELCATHDHIFLLQLRLSLDLLG
jgi:hypothetical protein